MGRQVPSENEWMIMEVLWNNGGGSMTAAEIIHALRPSLSISPKTVRVMEDARIYHYRALTGRETCLVEKEQRFVSRYFGGKVSLAVASFLRSADISDDELEQLQELVGQLREKRDD